MSIAKIDNKRLEFLMGKLREKISAGCSGSYRHFVIEVLNEGGEYFTPTRAMYDHAMRDQIVKELTRAGTQ